MIKYAWFASKLTSNRCIFNTVNEVCFPVTLMRNKCICNGVPFIKCAWCEVTLCFKCFYNEYHPKSWKNNNTKCNFFLNYVFFPIKQSFLNNFFCKKPLKNFYCKNNFSLIQSGGGESGQKIQTGDIVVAIFLLYHCAVDASALHAARHDTTRLQWQPTFSIIFFRRKANALGQKKKYVSNEIN
jgi:hypothetical protein